MTRPPHRVDGIRCAQVDVASVLVTLSFLGDLTPVEAVAAFLRDAADCTLDDELLRDLADQLDPPYIEPEPASRSVVTLTPKAGIL